MRKLKHVKKWIGLMAVAAWGCSGDPEPVAGPMERPVYEPTAPAEADRVVTTDPEFETPAWLANGFFGARFGRDGMALPGRFMHIEAYQPQGEEKIATFDPPFPTAVYLDGERLDPTQGEGYEQAFEFHGNLITQWTQDDVSVRIVAETRAYVIGWTAEIDAEPSRIELDWNGERYSAATFPVFEVAPKHPAPDTFEGHPVAETQVEVRPSVEPSADGTTLKWDVWRIWGYEGRPPNRPPWASIEIDGPVEDQQAINSFLAYLRMSVPDRTSGAPVSPLNLSGTTYFGHVFWDADVWVFPALSMLDPWRAQQIPSYRLQKLRTAQTDNFPEWVEAGWPVAQSEHAPNPELVALAERIGVAPAKYPWESSVSGRETVPGESRFQEHISGSAAWAVWKAAALGLVDVEEAQTMRDAVAAYYLHRMALDDQGRATLLATMSPDEHHIGDSDLYTNLLADWAIAGALGEQWTIETYLPRDDQGLITYENDDFRGYKQAAAVLAIYPLQHPEAEATAIEMLERFEPNVIETGPAMTDSIHALIRARFGDADEAYATWKDSWQKFTRHPLLMFSEKRSRDVTYFSTGAAGCLQTVLYGFLGLRIDEEPWPDTNWSIPLENGQVLSARPNLPSAWNSVKISNLSVGDVRYDVTFTRDGVDVIESPW